MQEKTVLPPTTAAMAAEHPDGAGSGFCSGAQAERLRVAADMRRRASALRTMVGELAGKDPKPVEGLSGLSAVLLKDYLSQLAARMWGLTVAQALDRAELWDKYAEDLERIP